MEMILPQLQEIDKEVRKLRLKRLPEGWEDIEEIIDYQGFSYVSKVIFSKLISRYYDNLLAGYFGIEKTQELIVRK